MSIAATGGGTMKPVHKLRAHTGPVLCCATSPNSPNEVVSSSEDGTVGVFDLRSRSCSTRLQMFGGEPVASVSLNPENVTELFAAAGAVLYCVDLRMGSSGRELLRFDVNLDEINQVVVNQKATYVCAADDSGEIKVIDVHNRKLYRTLRGVHTNICSAVQFHGQKPWEVISGGLDSKVVKWDFSKGRDLRSLDLAADSAQSAGQLCNPPFVHALAIPHGDGSGEIGRLVAVARGDGAVEVYDTGFENDKFSGRKGLGKKKDKHQNNVRQGSSFHGETGGATARPNGLRCHLDSQQGGHVAAVSSVAFTRFGETGQYIVSGGNDKFVKLWNWRSSNEKSQLEDRHALVLDIQHGKKGLSPCATLPPIEENPPYPSAHKVNWLTTNNRSSGSLVVADTSKVLSVYHIL